MAFDPLKEATPAGSFDPFSSAEPVKAFDPMADAEPVTKPGLAKTALDVLTGKPLREVFGLTFDQLSSNKKSIGQRAEELSIRESDQMSTAVPGAPFTNQFVMKAKTELASGNIAPRDSALFRAQQAVVQDDKFFDDLNAVQRVIENPAIQEDLGVTGTLREGLKSTVRALEGAYALATDDQEALRNLSDAQIQRDQSLRDLMQDIEVRTAQLGDEAGWGEVAASVGAAFAWNPSGAAKLILEQAPNSLVPLATGGAGFAAGGPLGGIAGLFAGNIALETGFRAVEKFEQESREETLRKGTVKGAVIASVDTATIGLSNYIFGATRRAVEGATRKALLNAKVPLTQQGLQSAMLDPVLRQQVQVAQLAAVNASDTFFKRAGRGGTATVLESFGEGFGGYLGSLAADGEASKVEAVIEAFSSLGSSAATAGIVAAYNQTKLAEQAGQMREVTQAEIEVQTELTKTPDKEENLLAPSEQQRPLTPEELVVAQTQAKNLESNLDLIPDDPAAVADVADIDRLLLEPGLRNPAITEEMKQELQKDIDAGLSQEVAMRRLLENYPGIEPLTKRRIGWSTTPEHVGLSLSKIKVEPGNTVVVGGHNDYYSSEYTRILGESFEEWRREHLPQDARVVLNLSGLEDNHVGGYAVLESGIHVITPREIPRGALTEQEDESGNLTLLPNPETKRGFNSWTQQQIIGALSHELGHAKTLASFGARMPAEFSNIVGSLDAGKTFSEEQLALMPQEEAAVVRDFQNKKARILSGEMSAQEFMETWMGSWKFAKDILRKKRAPSVFAYAERALAEEDRLMGRPMRKGLDGVSARELVHALGRQTEMMLSESARGNKVLSKVRPTPQQITRSDREAEAYYLQFSEYMAEQFSRYAEQNRIEEKTPLAGYFNLALTSLRDYFKRIKADQLIKPGESFQRWMELYHEPRVVRQYNREERRAKEALRREKELVIPSTPVEVKESIKEVEKKPEITKKKRRKVRAPDVIVKEVVAEQRAEEREIKRKELEDLFHSVRDEVENELAGRTSARFIKQELKHNVVAMPRTGQDDLGFLRQNEGAEPGHLLVLPQSVKPNVHQTALRVVYLENPKQMYKFTVPELRWVSRLFGQKRSEFTRKDDLLKNIPVLAKQVLGDEPQILLDRTSEEFLFHVKDLERLQPKPAAAMAAPKKTVKKKPAKAKAIAANEELAGDILLRLDEVVPDTTEPIRAKIERLVAQGRYLEADDALTDYIIKTLKFDKKSAQSSREKNSNLHIYKGSPEADAARAVLERIGETKKASLWQKAINWTKDAQHYVLQVQQLAHQSTDEGTLAFNKYQSKLLALKNNLLANGTQVAEKWEHLGKKDYEKFNEMILEEYWTNEHKTVLLQDPGSGRWEHLPGQAFLDFLKKHGIDPETKKGETFAQLYLDMKNSLLEHIQATENIAKNIVGEKYKQAPLVKQMKELEVQELSQRWRETPFYPQGYFGDHVVSIQEKKASGKKETVFRAHFENAADQDVFVKQLLKKGIPAKAIRYDTIDTELGPQLILPTEFLSVLKDSGQFDADQLQMIGDLMIPLKTEKVFSKFARDAQRIAGASVDQLRNYASWIEDSSNFLSKLMYNRKMTQARAVTKKEMNQLKRLGLVEEARTKQRLLDTMEKAQEFIMHPLEEFYKTRSTIALSYLLWAPKTALMNLTGMFQTWAAVTSDYGEINGHAILASTVKDLTLNKLSFDEKWVQNKALEDGVLDQGFGYFMSGLANAGSWARRLRPTLAGKAWRNFIDMGMWPFKAVEVANRKVTLLSVYRAERNLLIKEGMSSGDAVRAAYEKASRYTRLLQNDYSSGNRPEVLRGKWKSLMMIFVSYPQYMLWIFSGGFEKGARMEAIAAGRTPRSRMAGMTMKMWILFALMAGAEGVPFGEFMTSLLQRMYKTLGGDANIRLEQQRFLKETLGIESSYWRKVIQKGFLHDVLGVDLSGSLSLGSPLPGLRLIDPHARNWQEFVGEVFSELSGPFGGAVKAPLALTHEADGHVSMADVGRSFPGFIGAGARAFSAATDDMKTRQGERILRDDAGNFRKATPMEVALLAGGFRLSEVARFQETRHLQRERRDYWTGRRTGIKQAYKRALEQGDVEYQREVLSDMDSYNKEIPHWTLRLNMKELNQYVRDSRRRVRKGESGIHSKRDRDLFREVERILE